MSVAATIDLLEQMYTWGQTRSSDQIRGSCFATAPKLKKGTLRDPNYLFALFILLIFRNKK